jgi:hypothetical protein
LAFVRVNTRTGETHLSSLTDQYEAVTDFRLNASVPEDISVHFETAKNLYLYAWFVYRFYPVAEQQAFATLEFALRVRQPDFVAQYKGKHRHGHEPGLGALLKRAINDELIRNDRFPQREAWALKRAKARFRYQLIERTHCQGLAEVTWDDSGVIATEEDRNYDWLGTFLESIPDIRNIYAHGSSMLVPTVRHTFDVTTAIINQLYPSVVE